MTNNNERKYFMSGLRSRYTPEFRENTAKHIIESKKSVAKVAEDIGAGKAVVYKWMQDYRKKHGLPTAAEERGLKPLKKKTEAEILYEKRELEKELKRKNKELADQKETIEILKKSLAIFTQQTS